MRVSITTCYLLLSSFCCAGGGWGWLGVAGAGAVVVMFQDLDVASYQIFSNQRSLLIKYKNVTFSYLNSYGTSYNMW